MASSAVRPAALSQDPGAGGDARAVFFWGAVGACWEDRVEVGREKNGRPRFQGFRIQTGKGITGLVKVNVCEAEFGEAG